jgi:Domain of unknown function (DUF4388)
MFVLSGTVDSLHLGDLLEWLHLTRASGRLLLVGSSVTRAFDIVKGRVAFASSSRAAERLASWLLRKGVVARQPLLRALAVAQIHGEAFTEVVERDGGVSHAELVEAGRSLATALASRTLRESRIGFRFDPEWPVTAKLHVDLELECSKLIMQAAYTVDTRPPADPTSDEVPVTVDPAAIEALFWRVVAEAQDELVDAAALAEAHEALKAVGSVLHRWVTQGPPLLPLATDDIERIGRRLAAGEPIALDDSPALAWDLLSLVNGLDAPGFSRASSLSDAWVMAGDDAPGLVRQLVESSRWRRETRGAADGTLRRTALARAAAARSMAGLFGLAEETAATAATLPVVTLGLVVTALASAPLASGTMQRSALRLLLPIVGHAAGLAAGHPEVLLAALTGRPAEHLGARIASLAAMAAQEVGGGVYPGTPFDDGGDPDLAAAMDAARAAARRAVAASH